MRVVSLLPAATEIMAALGAYDELVGVTFECDEPPQARREKAVLVGGIDTTAMSPVEIDEYVRAAASSGTPIYTLHRDALAALEPELILTQDLCQVCAIGSGQLEDALDHLGCRAEVLSLRPQTLAEVWDSISAIGAAVGRVDEAERLVASLRSRIDALGSETARRPRVLVVEWTDPPFGAGHWIPDLVTAAGGEPVAAHPGAASVATSWDAMVDAAPDIVVVAPCGSGLESAAAQAVVVADRFPASQVWAVDADGLVVRPGPRLALGAETLAAIIQPALGPPDPRCARLVRSQRRSGEPLADRRLVDPHPSRVPADAQQRDAILATHADALEAGELGYHDPQSGLFVLTAGYLADRGFCCGQGCRHCPYVEGERPN